MTESSTCCGPGAIHAAKVNGTTEASTIPSTRRDGIVCQIHNPSVIPVIHPVNPNTPQSDRTVKRIVCFANSRKDGGRCVAGKEVLPDGRLGAWIRPVSGLPHGGVSEDERCYEDGREPSVLDVIDVPVVGPHPKDYQQENWRLDSKRRWTKVARIQWNALPQWADAGEDLWIVGHSSSEGQNDRIPLPDANSLRSSLRLIEVRSLQITVSEPAKPSNPIPALRAAFHYNGHDYSLRITDPVSESGAVKMDYGNYNVDGQRFLTISMGRPFEGYVYKLIAAVIKPN